MKINRILKIIITFLSICLITVGMAGFIMGATGKINVGKFYKQHPLNEKNGIVADTNGNIYIGEYESGSIQVYDKLGNFKYGFGLPTGGAGHWFSFGIDQDKIHVVTTSSYFIFDKGKSVYSEEEIDYNSLQELQIKYHMSETKSYEINNKIYRILPFNNVSIQDKLNGKVEQIHLNAPIWPLPIWVFWVMGAVGMALIFILYYQIFFTMVKLVKR